MKRTALFTSMALVLAAGSVVSCGGGSGSSNTSAAGVTTVGTVTGFGSVYVNGVEFQTGGATFTIDDKPGTEADLDVGMVVKIKGSTNGANGSALSVSYDDDIEGPVSGLIRTATSVTFSVFGLNVIASQDTVFSEEDVASTSSTFSFDTIADADIVEISGYFNGVGDLVASHIEKQTKGLDDFEAKGTVSGYTATGFTLIVKAGDPNATPAIPDVTIDVLIDNTTQIEGNVMDGSYVEVEGTVTADMTVTPPVYTLTASKVQLEDMDGLDDNDEEVSVEGIAVYHMGTDSYTINNIPVDFSGAEFEPSSLADLIASGGLDGMRLEAEGSMVNGTLVVSEVEAEDGDIEIKAMVNGVTSTDLKNGVITLDLGTAGSLDVTVNNTTMFKNESSMNHSFTLDDLINATGPVYLSVKAYDNGTALIAKRLDYKTSAMSYKVQGPVESKDATAGTVTVLGLTYTITDGITSISGVSPADAATFISTVTVTPITYVEISDSMASSFDGVADEAKIAD